MQLADLDVYQVFHKEQESADMTESHLDLQPTGSTDAVRADSTIVMSWTNTLSRTHSVRVKLIHTDSLAGLLKLPYPKGAMSTGLEPNSGFSELN